MGYVLKRGRPDLDLVSLDVSHSGGSAWLCTSDGGCGIRSLSGRGEGDEVSVEVHDEIQPHGHHGRYHVGTLHGSPPAIGVPE